MYEISRPLSSATVQHVSQEEWDQAHLYVWRNNNEVEPFIEQHMAYLRFTYRIKAHSRKWLQDEHNRRFVGWLRETVAKTLNHTKANISDELRWIAHGPRMEVLKYSTYMVDGVRSHTKQRDDSRAVQNYGVSIVKPSLEQKKQKSSNEMMTKSTNAGNKSSSSISKKKPRGPTILHQIIKNKTHGKKKEVAYNDNGVGVGEGSTKLSSFIGCTVRETVPISIELWHEDPKDFKTKIWDAVNQSFIVDPNSRKKVISIANNRWRKFKSNVARTYIYPHKNDPDKLRVPPSIYEGIIKQEHWERT